MEREIALSEQKFENQQLTSQELLSKAHQEIADLEEKHIQIQDELILERDLLHAEHEKVKT